MNFDRVLAIIRSASYDPITKYSPEGIMFKYDLGNGADLRILELRHSSALLTFVSENRSYLGEWLGWANTMTTIQDAENFIKRGIVRFSEDGLPWVGVWLHNQLVGGVLFFPVDWRIRSTKVGYWLGQGATRQGIMTRTLEAMLRFVFEDVRLNRVELEAEVENWRSRAVADRLGFTLEGIRRQGWLNGADLVDLSVYALLSVDWAHRHAVSKSQP